MKTTNNFEPVGKRFYSQSMHREMMIVTEGEFSGWIVYKHPDGQWVTLRKASPQDLADIATAGHRKVFIPSETAPDLIAALERLLAAPDLNCENLEPETIAAIEHAGKILAKARGEKAP